MQHRSPRRTRACLLFLATLLFAGSTEATVVFCPGDCDRNGAVSNLDIEQIVRIALAEMPAESCPSGILASGVAIDDLVTAVRLSRS